LHTEVYTNTRYQP